MLVVESDTTISITDDQWARIAPLLPKRQRNRTGRPRMDDRQVMTAVLYRFRTGCSWKALPRSMGAGSTVYGRFQEWRNAQVFEKMMLAGILQAGELGETS